MMLVLAGVMIAPPPHLALDDQVPLLQAGGGAIGDDNSLGPLRIIR